MAEQPQGDTRRDRGRVLSKVDNYGRVPVGVLLGPTLDDAAKVMYGYLTTWDFRRTGRMFGGREDFAADLGWSVSKVDRALAKLAKAEYIAKIRRGRGLVNDILLLAETVRVVESEDLESPDMTALDSADVTTPISRENARENQETAEQAPPSCAKKKPRARSERDAHFTALESAFGPASTGSRGSFYGKAVTQVMEAGGKPEDIIRARVAMSRRGWEHPTPEAMLKHWDDLLADAQPRARPLDHYEAVAARDMASRRGAG